jgi:DNA polymerase-3 subunit gamma/tau
MLSTQAWNAFLKTLEEPPPNTVFVLATTEAGKVLPTVVDRCHRFDFGRPTVEQLAAVVRRVAERERIDIAPDAIALLARHATGSFRDALGTLEQLVTYASADADGETSSVRIATDDVLAVLGVADADLLFAAFDAIAAGDARAALLAAARLTQSGRDALGFVRDLEAHARDLMIVQTLGGVPAELRITPERDARLEEQSGRVGTGAIARLLDLLAGALDATKNGSDARTQLELALVKAAAPAVDPSTQALLQRVERLEAALRGESPAPPSQPALRAESPAPPSQPAPGPESPPAPPAPAPDAPQPPSTPAPEMPRPAAREQAPPPTPAPREHAPPPTPAPPIAPAVSPVPAAADAAAIAVASPVAVELESLHAVWPAVLEQVKASNALCAALLEETRPVSVDGPQITVAFAPDAAYLLRKADDEEYRACVAEAIRQVTGAKLRVSYVLAEAGAATPEAVVAPTDQEWVQRFVAEFDAEEIHPESEAS